MNWNDISGEIEILTTQNQYSVEQKNILLSYSKKLVEQNLPIIYDVKHLSMILGIKPNYIMAACNKPEAFYRYFSIPKRNGGTREIAEPLPLLKEIQRWILDSILVKVEISKFSKAFERKKSIKDNARLHRKRDVIVLVDVQDFFPSIKFTKVYNVFRFLGYNDYVSKCLANLCCLNSSLPQGAPTSPMLSNIVMRNFDNDLAEFCLKRELRYSRYADDVVVSGNNDFPVKEVIALVRDKLSSLGLSVNSNKTRVLHKGQRQLVTGLVVNQKMSVPKEYVRLIRQEIYYIRKHGIEDHIAHAGITRKNYIYHLIGKIAFVLMVNPKDQRMREYKKYLLSIAR